MKAVSLPEIKKELHTLSSSQIQELCLRLARFKKENKELLSYLLFESHNETNYIETIKRYINNEFQLINTNSFFYIRKSVRKILRNLKKYSRYSQKKETEVEILLHFCKQLKDFKPDIKQSNQLKNMYNRQLLLCEKIIETLHDDLQYDFNLVLTDLKFI